MDHFTCPRCLAVSWSPPDVAAGYCGSCHDVTRIEGLTVQMLWRAGEWECKPCGLAYAVPFSHSHPPAMCTCGRVMTKLLRPEVTVDPALYGERSRQEAEMHLGQRAGGRQLRALRGERPLRSLEEGRAPWLPPLAQGEEEFDAGAGDPGRILQSSSGHRLTGRDWYRLARTAERGPEGPAARARALLEHFRRRGGPSAGLPRGSVSPGQEIRVTAAGEFSRTWAYVGTIEGEMGWAQADLSQLDARQQPYAELASGVLESMQRLADLTMEVSARLTEEQAVALYERAAGRSPGQEMYLDAIPESSASWLGPDDLPPADDSSIEAVLLRNQIVIDAARALIENHSPSAEPDEHEIPWSDPATWSPGDTEL